MLIGGQPESEAKFRIILEKRVGPGGATALMVLGPRRVRAINRRTAGGIGDHRAVAEELIKIEIAPWRSAHRSLFRELGRGLIGIRSGSAGSAPAIRIAS